VLAARHPTSHHGNLTDQQGHDLDLRLKKGLAVSQCSPVGGSATSLYPHGARWSIPISVGEGMDRHDWRTVEMVNRYRHLLEATDTEAAKTIENA
jgi:hypothetical protein